MERNKLSKEDATNKINSQMPMSVKVAKSDILVENSGSKNDLDKKMIHEMIPLILRELKLDSK